MPKIEQEDYSDVERALAGLRPIAPSERFFGNVEAELSAEKSNALPMPARGNAIRFPLRRVAASAALAVCAVGLGVWSYSVLPETPKLADAETETVVDFADEAAPMLAVASLDDSAEETRGGNGGNFRLVDMERRMNSAKLEDCVANTDGTVARRVRYSYTDEYCWEDDDGDSAYIELRPHEEVISMEMAVY